MTTLIRSGTNGRYSDTATRNIESILKLEKEDQEELSPYHRVSHAIGWFVGTVYFVVFECAMVLGWIAFNVALAPAHWPFDPYPFPLLAVVLGLEAVLLTSFVLIRQNAIDRTSERRNHLDLQINLLAEGRGDEGSQDARGDRGSSEIARSLRQQGSLTGDARRIHRPRPARTGEEGSRMSTTPSVGSRLRDVRVHVGNPMDTGVLIAKLVTMLGGLAAALTSLSYLSQVKKARAAAPMICRGKCCRAWRSGAIPG